MDRRSPPRLRFGLKLGLTRSASEDVGLSLSEFLSLSDVLDRPRRFILRVENADVAAFRPPILAMWIEFQLQRPRRPCLQINSHFLEFINSSGDNHVNVVGSTIDCMKGPLTKSTSLGDLRLDALALVGGENARVLGHLRFRLKLANRIGKLPSASMLDPASGVSRKPSAICDPREEAECVEPALDAAEVA